MEGRWPAPRAGRLEASMGWLDDTAPVPIRDLYAAPSRRRRGRARRILVSAALLSGAALQPFRYSTAASCQEGVAQSPPGGRRTQRRVDTLLPARARRCERARTARPRAGIGVVGDTYYDLAVDRRGGTSDPFRGSLPVCG